LVKREKGNNPDIGCASAGRLPGGKEKKKKKTLVKLDSNKSILPQIGRGKEKLKQARQTRGDFLGHTKKGKNKPLAEVVKKKKTGAGGKGVLSPLRGGRDKSSARIT